MRVVGDLAWVSTARAQVGWFGLDFGSMHGAWVEAKKPEDTKNRSIFSKPHAALVTNTRCYWVRLQHPLQP